ARLAALGVAGSGRVNAAGWSMGGGVLMQYLLDHPGDLAAVTLVAPISPYGFGGTKDADGTLCCGDGAARRATRAAAARARRAGREARHRTSCAGSRRETGPTRTAACA